MSRYTDEAPGGGLLARLYTTTSLALFGVLGIALMAGALGLTVAVFTHAFDDPAEVTLDVDRAGSQLVSGADVKLNGIVVGRVDRIRALPDGSGATLGLSLEEQQLHLIPANVTAEVLPKTIFGEKYVDLVLPVAPDSTRIAAGDVITRDRSRTAIETSTVLNNLEPLLTAVNPAQLNATLTAIATAVRGRGELVGQTITDSNTYAAGVRPTVPQTLTDLQLLSGVADDYTQASGPLLSTLKNATTSARTLTAKQQQLARLLGATSAFADQTGQFIATVGPTAVEVVDVSEPVLEILRKYSPELACTIRGVVEAKDRLEAVFADGPFLKARLYVSVSRGTYKPGIDDPKSIDYSAYGPYCPITPSTNGGKNPPFPPIPKELDQLRGTPNPLETVNGIPGIPIEIPLPGVPTALPTLALPKTGSLPETTNSLVQLLFGGVLG